MPGILQPQQRTARPTAVEHDVEGVRQALLELLEEGFQIGRIHRAVSNDMSVARRDEQLAAVGQQRMLSPGFYLWAQHLLRLDAERNIGLALDPQTLSMAEGAGLRALSSARSEYRAKHPPCSRCGVEQEVRFASECSGCGVKFARKGAK